MTISLYTVRSVIFNLNHEMDSLHFISNEENHFPLSWSLHFQLAHFEAWLQDPLVEEGMKVGLNDPTMLSGLVLVQCIKVIKS